MKLAHCIAGQALAYGERLFQSHREVPRVDRVWVSRTTRGPIPLDSAVYLQGGLAWADGTATLERSAKSLLQGMGAMDFNETCWQQARQCIKLSERLLWVGTPIKLGSIVRAPRSRGSVTPIRALMPWNVESTPPLPREEWARVLTNVLGGQYLAEESFASPLFPGTAESPAWLSPVLLKLSGVYNTTQSGRYLAYSFHGTFPSVFGRGSLNGIVRFN